MRRVPATLLLALAVASASLAEELPESPETAAPIAVWKGGAVGQDQLDGWLTFFKREDDRSPDVRRAAIEELLMIETLARAAVERGADRQPALVLALERAEEGALVKALQSHRGERIEITGKDVNAHLEIQPDAFHRPRKVRLRNLYKRFPADAGEAEKAALRARMEELRTELAAGADFAQLALRESDSQTRFRKALLGNIPAGQLRPEIDAVAMKLEPGGLSPVLETEDGLTILQCDEIIAAYVPSAEEQRASLAAHLRRQRVKRDWADFQAELLAAGAPRFDLAVARDPAAAPEAVVARFEGGQRTRGELLAALATAPKRRDPADLGDGALRRLLEGLAVQALAAERARALSLDDGPELRRRLEWQRRRLLAGDEMGRRVQGQLEPLTEKEIRAWFEAHRGDFKRPRHYDLALIRVGLMEGEERQRYRRAEEVWARLEAGELDFAAAARAHSDHPSAAGGGALGWLSNRQLAGFGPRVANTVAALAAGEISELVQDDRSLYILRLDGLQEARPLTWEEAVEKAEQKLGNERVAEIQARIEAEIKAGLEVRLVGEATRG